MKVCNKCKENKELSAFSSNNSAKDGKCPTCKVCMKAYHEAYRNANRERIQSHQRAHYEANMEVAKKRAHNHRVAKVRDDLLDYYKEYYQQTKDRQRQQYRERYANSPELQQRRRDEAKAWREQNMDKVLCQTAARRAKKLNATPRWADTQAIAEFYTRAVKLSNETGVKHQVDHIIPLNSDLVCGLHVEHNLQILTADENNTKKCNFDPDCMNEKAQD